MIGAIRIGKQKKVQPIFSLKILWQFALILAGMSAVGYAIMHFWEINILRFFVVAILLNLFVIYVALRPIKKIAKGLTVEEAAVDTSL